ncbi:MAG: TIGR00269 family protein [Candidatus Pacearchaeota archaeon]
MERRIQKERQAERQARQERQVEERAFIERFENKVKKTIKEYDLISKNDKVVVACSGGKDSSTVLYLLNKFGYNVRAVMIDLLIGKWSEQNLLNVRSFCKEQGIKLSVINIREELGYSMCYIRSSIQASEKLNNCSICGPIRRWLLNKAARALKADKLATGHNLDDEAESVLMNIFKGNMASLLNLGPKPGLLTDKKFVQRIKPLYFCTNDEIKRYAMAKAFPVLYAPCPCRVNSFRVYVRAILARLAEKNPEIKLNLVRNVLRILPWLKQEAKREIESSGQGLRYCKSCGEPSRGELCKSCQLIRMIKASTTSTKTSTKMLDA